ncbi:TPA: hypothetical protein ACYZ9D_004428 [Escherichia coli]|nr:hypothetical protein [Escherichia coli]EFH6905944.1 hypothetical protein [Escherichia coli]EFU2692283.1 hypothetical protein [Escherichia coli]EGO6700781.1 hypothetical protein [Escherichia coli]
MGRSVSVTIGQTKFKSKKAAVEYFMDQREAVKIAGPLKKGELFDELRDLYLRYCEITEHSLGNREIYAFSVNYETRHTDQNYGTYLCYWVHFSPKDTDGVSFSVKQAVDAIASVVAEHP